MLGVDVSCVFAVPARCAFFPEVGLGDAVAVEDAAFAAFSV
jgi:hypothetical protein